jgi:hypothetical protein
VQQQVDGEPAHRVQRLADGGQLGTDEAGQVEVVEAGHQVVVRAVPAGTGEHPLGGDSVPVGGRHQRVERAVPQQVAGGPGDAALDVVAGRQERSRLQAVGAEHLEVRLVALLDVGGAPEPGEREPAAAVVPDQVGDGVPHAGTVVGQHGRAVQAGDGVADQHHRLAGRPEAGQVVAVGGVGEGHEAADVVPGDRGGELRVAAVDRHLGPGVQRLDRDQPATVQLRRHA